MKSKEVTTFEGFDITPEVDKIAKQITRAVKTITKEVRRPDNKEVESLVRHALEKSRQDLK